METETGEILSRTLDECEQVIEAGLGTFMQVGTALAEIRDARLYRSTHDDFDTYCIDRWGFDRKRASEFIIAAAVSEISDTPLANESHASALAPLKDEPDQMRAALAQATAEAEADGAKLTAQRIKDAVASVMGEATDREAVGVAVEPGHSATDDDCGSPALDPGGAALGDDAEEPSVSHTSPGSPPAPPPEDERDAAVARLKRSIAKAHDLLTWKPEDIHALNDPDCAVRITELMRQMAPWWETYKTTKPTGLVVHKGGKA